MFCNIGTFNVSISPSKQFKNAVLATKYISKSTPVLSGSHAAIDSNRKLFSASIIQLQSTFLFNKTYGWLGISIGIFLCVKQTICLKLGQLANTISYPPSNMEGFTSVLLK